MTVSLYSPSWYRVAALKPRLRSHAQIHRHDYRGELWYVLQDHATGQSVRFSPMAYRLLGLLDGNRTVQQAWDSVRSSQGDEAPNQEEVIRLLSQLHAMDALQTDVVPDLAELHKRFEKKRRNKRIQNLRSPLFLRFPLLDPEHMLNRFQPIVRPFFGWPGLLLWIVVVGSAVFQVGIHWPELTQNLTDRILTPQNLVVLWLTFPFLKIFHEFGHAFAVKLNGGEVHEMGIMLMVFTPIPFVDASAASAFREKGTRVLVGAAGMAVELFIAAIAVFVWINIEPGPLRSVAYNVIFIAGVSSVLFNGNPLLRYDAYYILSDLVEIPNLGPRGLKYLGYLFQRYLFGLKNAEPPPSTSGERVWFVVYSILAWGYRILVYASIVLFVATKFFKIGLLFAGWALFNMFVFPAMKGIRFITSSPRLRQKRMRAAVAAAALVCGVIGFAGWVPLPLNTGAEGVVWIPENGFVRAGVDGFVQEILAEPGSRVHVGEALILCYDPLLPAQIRVLESKLEERKALYDSRVFNDQVRAEIIKEEIRNIEAQIADAKERAEDLTIRSGADGVFVVPNFQDLPGRFLKRGGLVGYVLDRSAVTVRTVVFQPDIDLVRHSTRAVSVRFAEDIQQVIPAVLQREVPAATDRIPNRVLSQAGGGEIAVDPRDGLGMTSFQKIFLFDLELPGFAKDYHVGSRLHVRFSHGKEPLVWRLYRWTRQMFIKRLNV